jgi:hypothetical protein
MSEVIEIHENGVPNPGYTTDQLDEKQVQHFCFAVFWIWNFYF